MEAADAGIRYAVSITDGIPAQDMMTVKRYMRRYKKEQRMTLTGPNCAGTITPGKALMGIMPGHIYIAGTVGVVGRSGTLGYEAASQMKQLGIGISTSVGIGGDPINGSSFKDILALFENDPANNGGDDDRRNWRPARGGSGGVHPRQHKKTDNRIHCGIIRPPQRKAHGTRRSNHIRQRRIGGGGKWIF